MCALCCFPFPSILPQPSPLPVPPSLSPSLSLPLSPLPSLSSVSVCLPRAKGQGQGRVGQPYFSLAQAPCPTGDRERMHWPALASAGPRSPLLTLAGGWPSFSRQRKGTTEGKGEVKGPRRVVQPPPLPLVRPRAPKGKGVSDSLPPPLLIPLAPKGKRRGWPAPCPKGGGADYGMACLRCPPLPLLRPPAPTGKKLMAWPRPALA